MIKIECTPGQWEAVEVADGLWHVLPIERTATRVPIAVLDHHRDGYEAMRTVITPADARLMAAAPELFNALQYCLQELHDSNWGSCSFDRYAAALEKAAPDGRSKGKV